MLAKYIIRFVTTFCAVAAALWEYAKPAANAALWVLGIAGVQGDIDSWKAILSMYEVGAWWPWLVITLSIVAFLLTTDAPEKIAAVLKLRVYPKIATTNGANPATTEDTAPLAIVFQKRAPFWRSGVTMTVDGGILSKKQSVFIGVRNISSQRILGVNVQVTASNSHINEMPFRLPRLDGGDVPFVLEPNELRIFKLASRENRLGAPKSLILHSDCADIPVFGHGRPITLKIEAFSIGANAQTKITLIVDPDGDLVVTPLAIGVYDVDFDAPVFLELKCGPPTVRQKKD